MSLALSDRAREVLGRLFEEPKRSKMAARLVDEASENIPFCEKSTSSQMDRIRFSIMKLVGEDGMSEDSAFELAKGDWRDLFMSAGFGDSATAHEVWFDKLMASQGERGDTPGGQR